VACFVVIDGAGQKLAYVYFVYFEDEPGRRSTAKLLIKDEARRCTRTEYFGQREPLSCPPRGLKIFGGSKRRSSVARMRQAADSRPFAGCSLEAVDPVKRFGADKHERMRHVL